MIRALCVAGYRSLRDLRLSLEPLTVISGANSSGKSNLYRALRLLAEIAQGRIVPALAQEGGLDSTLWAGPEAFSRAMKRGEQPVQGLVRRDAVSLKLGFAGDDYGYAIDLGFPSPMRDSWFNHDPEIKTERQWTGRALGRANDFARRDGPLVRVKDAKGAWRQAMHGLASFDSMMTHCADPRDGLDLLLLREQLRDWRFYDGWRSDRDAPARRPCVGVRTPVLGAEGADLAAAAQTIREIGAAHDMEAAIDDAFPGARLDVVASAGLFELAMRWPGLLRPLKAAELSDGALRYLLLVVALLSPRPPALMVLNEPETSLHPDLMPSLARLIVVASKSSQIIVVSHAPALLEGLVEAGALHVALVKELGETSAPDAEPPPWTWPSR